MNFAFEFFGENSELSDMIEVSGINGIDSDGNKILLEAYIEKGFLRIRVTETEKKILEIAYLYENSPSGPTIYDSNGLPMGPFDKSYPTIKDLLVQFALYSVLLVV